MIKELRYRASLLFPARLKWWLVRKLPGLVTWTGKILQGIDPVWEKDAGFRKLYDSVAHRCLLDRQRAYVLYNIARNITGRHGANFVVYQEV